MHEAVSSGPRERRLGGDQVVLHVTAADSGSALVAAEVEIPAGGGPPYLHRHDSFELYRVESGELTFHLAHPDGGVMKRTGRAGAVVAIPSGAEHTIRNESGSSARAFVVFAPGTEMESFIRAVTALGEDAAPAAIATLAAENGIEMTRPLDGEPA